MTVPVQVIKIANEYCRELLHPYNILSTYTQPQNLESDMSLADEEPVIFEENSDVTMSPCMYSKAVKEGP